jgi:hypothetical protein
MTCNSKINLYEHVQNVLSNFFQIELMSAKMEKIYTFLDYVRGGYVMLVWCIYHMLTMSILEQQYCKRT